MRVRVPLPARTSSSVPAPAVGGAVAVLALGLVVAAAPSASAAPAAGTCRPSVTVLPLPPWAVRGSIADAVPGTAVGYVANAQGITRAMRWQRVGNHWVARPIAGVVGLGRTTSSQATAVNRHGAVIVDVGYSGPDARAWVAADGVLHPLADAAGGASAHATDINEDGTVVGSSPPPSPASYPIAVRWDEWDQPPQDLGLGGQFITPEPTAIDDAGDIAGTVYGSPNSGGSAFRIAADGTRVSLEGGSGSAHGATVRANDLNAAGRTVGTGQVGSDDGAVVWDGGRARVLPRLDGGTVVLANSSAGATAVSSSGVVVGWERDRTGSETPAVVHVLLYTDGGGVRSLLPPSTRWTDEASATAVDDAGTVYGTSYSTSLLQHPGQWVPTVWTCAVAQSFVPTATGVPASAPKPDVVIEQG